MVSGGAQMFRVRGQLSVEMLVAMTLALIFFGWAANFVGAWSSSQSFSSVAAQERAVASSLARLANLACASNASVELELPCISIGSRTAPSFLVDASGSSMGILAEGANYTRASVGTACPVLGSFEARCVDGNSGTACVWNLNGDARITEGACT